MAARRLRLRRRLLGWSAPVMIAVLVVAVKMISVVVAGNSAVSNFEAHDIDGLRGDVAALRVLNVLEPERAPFAAGTLAVLEADLDEADARFSDALSRRPGWCPAMVNLALVRERQGDIDAWEARPDPARDRYRSALAVVEAAPQNCFAGNNDPDPQRRAVREDTAARLAAKIAGVSTSQIPATPPPPPPAAAPPPAPPSAPVEGDTDRSQTGLRLNPGSGDPLDRLRQILQDAA